MVRRCFLWAMPMELSIPSLECQVELLNVNIEKMKVS